MGGPKIGIADGSRAASPFAKATADKCFRARFGRGAAMRLGKAGGRIGFELADSAFGDGFGGCQHWGQVSVLAALASSSQISSSSPSSW